MDKEEVAKVNRQTGDIMWRSRGKANQSTFMNDPIGFNSHSHAQSLETGKSLLLVLQ
ncbi:MAG: hypothetical protein AAF598_06655 [Bacteroidota bacterium]